MLLAVLAALNAKFGPSTISESEVQPRTKVPISVTFEVSKLIRLIDVKALSHWNIEDMLVKLVVTKLLRSSEVNPVQFKNMLDMFSTFAVLNLETSIEVRPLQPENMANIVVTF